MKIYREVKVSDRLPSNLDCNYLTDKGIMYGAGIFIMDKDIEWWLEKVELPSGDEVCLQSSNEAYQRDSDYSYEQGHNDGANYILDFLKK